MSVKEEKINSIRNRYDEVLSFLGDPDVINDKDRYLSLTKELGDLEPKVEAINNYMNCLSEISEAEEMLGDSDMKDLHELAQEQLNSAKEMLPEVDKALTMALMEKDPRDDRNVIMEIRGGAGGEEAALFAATVVHAADCYWAGETSSAWETSGNWTTTARKPTNDGGYFRSDKFHNKFKSGSRAYLVTFSAAETNNWRTYFNNCGTASAPIVLRANDAASGLTGGDSTNKDAKNYEGIYIGTNQTGGNGGSTDSKASTGNAYVRFESGTYATRNTYS